MLKRPIQNNESLSVFRSDGYVGEILLPEDEVDDILILKMRLDHLKSGEYTLKHASKPDIHLEIRHNEYYCG